MIDDKDLYWLAGIVDGEGSVHLKQRCGKQNLIKFGGKSPTFAPVVSIGNTDVGMLHRVSEILVHYDIKFYWQVRRSLGEKYINAKEYLILAVEGYRSVKALAELICDKVYTHQKKAQLEVVLEYINNRLDELSRDGGTADINAGMQYYNECKRLSSVRIPPSTTKRVASTVLSW